jgi:DNA-binding CsgD family transcriptional regulator
MLTAFALSFDMNDRSDDLDVTDWRAIALGALARSGDALVVCDASLQILYCSPRANHLLRRFPDRTSPKALPTPVAAVVKAQLSAKEAHPTDTLKPALGNAIEVQATSLRFSDRANVSIYLREEVIRDDEVYNVLRERFGVSMRGFQLAMLIRKGLSNRQIAERLTLAESTVKIYLHQLYKTCGVSSRTGLIALLDRLP